MPPNMDFYEEDYPTTGYKSEQQPGAVNWSYDSGDYDENDRGGTN